MERFLNRIARSALVFTQVDFEPLSDAARRRHDVVYDVFTPHELDVEGAERGDEDINLRHFRHSVMCDRAERIFVNGRKTIKQYKNLLSKHEHIINNPFCPISVDLPACPREKLIFFSEDISSVDSAPLFEIMFEYLSERPDVLSYLLAPGERREDKEGGLMSRLTLLPNLRIVNSRCPTQRIWHFCRNVALRSIGPCVEGIGRIRPRLALSRRSHQVAPCSRMPRRSVRIGKIFPVKLWINRPRETSFRASWIRHDPGDIRTQFTWRRF